MNLKIVPVDDTNRKQVENLTVLVEQKHFIETVKECMMEADEISDWEPVCIYDGDILIGFAMYGYMRHETLKRVWFDRLLIDYHYQKRGYGRKSVELIISRIKEEYPNKEIYISAYEDNKIAISLYKSFGFVENGELDINGEKIMVLTC